MSKKYDPEKRWGNRPVNFVAMLIVSFIIINVTLVVYGFMSEDAFSLDNFSSLFSGIVEVIPFGNSIANLVRDVAVKLIGLNVTAFTKPATYPTFADGLVEFLKLCVTAVAFEGFFAAAEHLTGLDEREGIWNKGQDLVLNFLVAYLSGLLVSNLMTFFSDQLQRLPAFFRILIPALVTLGALGGLFAIVHMFAASVSLGIFIVSFFVKYVIGAIIKIVATYFFLLLFILGVSNGNLQIILGSCGGIIVIFIMLGAIDLMLKSVFE